MSAQAEAATAAAPAGAAPPAWSVRRSTRASKVTGWSAGALLVVLIGLPQFLGVNVVEQCTSLFGFVILAVMWNALAGYGGMVSVGQQAFIGVGAYATIYLTQHGVSPYLAVVLAAFVAGAVALVLAPVMLRLRGAQFAIGMWVVAEALAILVSLDHGIGGGTGASLRGLDVYTPAARQAYTYWLTLAFTVVLLGAVLLLLRRRSGAALQAIRDDEQAAASLGVRVRPIKLGLFVLAGFGCGAAGALILANTLFVQPSSIFGINYTAYMIFMVLVGGLGTFEGPILGAMIFFFIQYEFAGHGAAYLIGLGAVAIVFALFVPRGLWSLVTDRLDGGLLPVGYRLVPAGRDAASPPR